MVNNLRIKMELERTCIKESPIITQSTGKKLESPTSNAAKKMEKEPIDQTDNVGGRRKPRLLLSMGGSLTANQAKPGTRQTKSANAQTCDCVLPKRPVLIMSVLALAATSTTTTSGELLLLHNGCSRLFFFSFFTITFFLISFLTLSPPPVHQKHSSCTVCPY